MMMAVRNDRSSNASGGSSNRSFSQEEQVDAFSAENVDIPGGREATSSRHARSGIVAVRASERFHSSTPRHGDGRAASATSRVTAASATALRAGESPLLSSSQGHDGKDVDNTANRVRSFSSSSSDGVGHIEEGNSRRLEEGSRRLSSRSQIKEERKTSLAETKDHGDGLNSHRNRDVGVLAALRTVLFGARDPESDLSIEMLEELHMVTGFTYKELRITRSHFLALVKDATFITREEFLEIPSVANNPLRERLLVCFGFDSMDNLKFKEFVEILSIFNNPSAQRDQKLRMAFTLVDIDGDGQVSKNDLVRYLDLITAAPEGVKLDLNAVAARVIEEGVSTPGAKSLSLADFIKIMGAADFADKLTIPL